VREGQVDFEGKYYSAPNCSIIPRGPSPKGPKILIGGNGNRVMTLAARYADCWNTIVGEPQSFIEPKRRIEEELERVGRSKDTLSLIPWINVIDLARSSHPDFIKDYVINTKNEIARTCLGYRELQVAQIVLRCFPNVTSSLSRLLEGAKES
jgi:hypothetical protein